METTYRIEWSIKTGRKGVGTIGETLWEVAAKDVELARESVRQMAREFLGSERKFKVTPNMAE